MNGGAQLWARGRGSVFRVFGCRHRLHAALGRCLAWGGGGGRSGPPAGVEWLPGGRVRGAGEMGLDLMGSAGSWDCALLGSEASLTLRTLFLGGGTAAPRADLTGTSEGHCFCGGEPAEAAQKAESSGDFQLYQQRCVETPVLLC